MEIRELPDFRHDWNIMFQEDNLDLLEYVVDVANKFHPFYDGESISESEDPMTFNDRYIESTLDLRGRYDRMRSMGWLKDCSWEDFEKTKSNAGIPFSAKSGTILSFSSLETALIYSASLLKSLKSFTLNSAPS